MTAIDAALVAVYRATDYVIFDDERQITLRIDEVNPAADDLLRRLGAATATLITAWNPESVPLLAAENDRRQAMLWQWIADHRLFAFSTEARDPSGQWPAEEGYLILDIAAETVAALGREFDQNAIVTIALGQAPELILLR
jgi:hypothetical protein